MVDQAMLIAILAATVTAGTPLLYAALGEIIAERAGVLNLGIEGMMLVGAVTGFLITVNTANPWLGVAGALAAGGLLALIHAFLCVTLQANQVVSGLALTLFGTGLSGYLGKSLIGVPAPKTFTFLALPGLYQIPYLGPVFFSQDILVYFSYLLVPLIWFFFYKTRQGLNLRAIGENPPLPMRWVSMYFSCGISMWSSAACSPGWPEPIFPWLMHPAGWKT